MKRRAVLASVPAVLLSAGCTDLLGDDEVVFEAETAAVSESARSETGYSETRIEEQEVRREFEDVDQTVVAVNVAAEYARSVEVLSGLGGELARFTALSTPKIDVVPGEPANPVADMSNADLAEMVQEEYDGIDDVERVDEREAELLDETVAVSVFDAEGDSGGDVVNLRLHIAQGESGDDFVVCVAAHPDDIDEADNVDRLLGGVEHPV